MARGFYNSTGIPIRKGKKDSLKTCKKRNTSLMGRKTWNKGLTKKDPRVAKNYVNRYGKKLSDEHRKKISTALLGDKSFLWKGGVSKINRRERENVMSTIKYKIWRDKIYKRDNYTCQVCYARSGIKLSAHHILPYEQFSKYRFDLKNGITLCSFCHKKTFNKEWLYAPSFLGI